VKENLHSFAIPSWERSHFEDDGQALSTLASILLRAGAMLNKPRAISEPEASHRAEDGKFDLFLHFFPEARQCSGKVVIDIGGGRGDLSKYLSTFNASMVYCIEPNPDWIAEAKETCSGCHNIEVLRAFGQDLPLPTSSADVVVLHDVMEHVSEPLALLKEARRVLRPGGSALVSFVPWASPYGGHTWAVLPVPWGHLLYSRRILAEMRSNISGWHTTELGGTGLYKLSVAGFLKHVSDAGLEVKTLNGYGIRAQHWLTKLPVLRELCTSVVGARLTR
jgi:SAM-dependent methyltransferase